MTKLRVVFYARVSTDHEDQLHSFAAQQDYFKKYILSQPDMIFIRGYADEGISGTSTKHRKQFLRMMEDARLGLFDLILTKEVSRFARNTVDTLSYTRELSRLNIGVIFTNDAIDTRQKDGELRLSIMASLAQDESRKISERVNWAVQRNYEKGVVHGGMPFGYRRNKDKKIVIYEPEAKIVREIFQLYLSGLGCRNIIKKLCEDEEVKPLVENWDNSRISRMIKNPKYCGDLVQGLSYTDDFLSKSRKKQDDISKVYYIENHHQGIISKDIYNKAQQERERRNRIEKGAVTKKYCTKHVFSNKVECYHCHYSYTRKTRIVKGERYTYWMCSFKSKKGKNACPQSQNISEDVLYEVMRSVFDCLSIQYDVIIRKFENIFKNLINQQEDEKNLLKLTSEKEKLEIQRDKLIDLNIQGFIDSTIFIKKYDALQTQIENIDMKINQMTGDSQNKPDYQKQFHFLMDYVKDKALNWKNIKDELISKILLKIEVQSKEEFYVYLSANHDFEENYKKNGYFLGSVKKTV